MARPQNSTSHIRLTKTVVDRFVCPAGAERAVLFDATLPGFHVEALASGRRVYRLRWTKGGRQGRETLGEHGSMTCDEARAKATILRGQLFQGFDPARQREDARLARRRAITIAALIELWLTDGRLAAPNKRESSWETDARKLRLHIVPLLGAISAAKLTRQDIERAQGQIVAGGTARDARTARARGRSIVKGGVGAARGAIMSLSTCLSWAVQEGIIAVNPCEAVKVPQSRAMQRFLTDDEAARLLQSVQSMEMTRAIAPVFADIIRLLLLTGGRKSEIQLLNWREVDLARGLIVLPRERSKTGEKVIVLGDQALLLLAQRRQRAAENAVWVFPSPQKANAPVENLQKAWRRIRAHAGLDDVRLHDLRHSFASFAAARGATLLEIGKALGHSQPSSTARYAHLGESPLRRLANQVGNALVLPSPTNKAWD